MENTYKSNIQIVRKASYATGFTLIELMIVIAIVAIIVAIAYPNYLDYIKKSRRAEAQSALMKAASNQVQHFLDNKAFTQDMIKLGFSTSPAIVPELVTPDSKKQFYSVSVPAAPGTSPPSFTLVATAINDQLRDTDCRTFTYTNKNEKGAKNSSGSDTTNICW